MLNSVLNRNIVLACLADCPADNQARQLALFLYETFYTILKKNIVHFIEKKENRKLIKINERIKLTYYSKNYVNFRINFTTNE